MAASSSPYFYPRPPRGGRPTTWTTRPRHRKFLSTPSARRATSFAYAGKLLFPISIHALREEGDSLIPPRTLPRWNFYPRPPRGGRQKVYDLTGYSVEFLSTPSARRATAPKTSSLVGALSFLSTPSARRATSIAFIKLDMACYFYPRPPRGGRLRADALELDLDKHFYPRPPRGGRRGSRQCCCPTGDFYPRPPRGGRPDAV